MKQNLTTNGGGTIVNNNSGSAELEKVDVTADYTMNGTEDLVVANGTLTITLPLVSGRKKPVRVINSGTGTITIQRKSSDTIEGETSISISSQYGTVSLIGNEISTQFEF